MEINLLSKQLKRIKGLIVLALIDAYDGSILEYFGDEFFNIDLADAEGANLLSYQRQLMAELDSNDYLEGVLVTMRDQYHIVTPLETNHTLFLYAVLDRTNTNLAFARYEIQQVERNLNFYTY
ncbi:roadblock/LC7 domain-containing protein [Acinetobacter junii]|uniref:roadblock/LC7 domain-containing protein n=1 Tax=Acinetobacter junii TaxID=40215 RepID=UPI003A884C74